MEAVELQYLLEDVLPFLKALFSVVRHLLDRHHLVLDNCREEKEQQEQEQEQEQEHLDIVPCIVDCPEAAMTNLTQVVEYFVRVFSLEQLIDVRVLGDGHYRSKLREEILFFLLFFFFFFSISPCWVMG